MSSSFDAFGGHGEDLPEGMDVHSGRPFDSDGYAGYDPRLPSQRFETFEMSDRFPDEHFPLDEMKDPDDDFKVSHNGYDPFHGGGPPPYHSAFDEESIANSPDRSSSAFGQAFESSPQPDFGSRADDFSPDATSNGKGFGHDQAADGLFAFSPEAPAPFGNNNNGPILPPPDELQPEEGFILREWRRQNAIHLEEKERKERERLSQIIDAADAYKQEYYVKRKTHCETSKSNNREKEKVFLATHESFHTNADKHYWKAIAELVPHELPSAIDTRSRGKKDKKPTVIVNQGPKPGKATDLSRMRQILLKLKHNPPAHMKEKKVPPAPSAPANGTAPAPAPASASAPTPAPTPTPATSAPAVQEAAAPA